MDSNSGRLPLDFVSLYSDMSTEQMLEESTKVPTGAVEDNPPAVRDPAKDVGESATSPGISPTSLSTEKSLGAYIEKTITELTQRVVIQVPAIGVSSVDTQSAAPEVCP